MRQLYAYSLSCWRFSWERAKREAKKEDLTFPSLSLHPSPFKPQISNFLTPLGKVWCSEVAWPAVRVLDPTTCPARDYRSRQSPSSHPQPISTCLCLEWIAWANQRSWTIGVNIRLVRDLFSNCHFFWIFSGSVFGLKKWDYWCWIEALVNHLQNDKYANSTSYFSSSYSKRG